MPKPLIRPVPSLFKSAIKVTEVDVESQYGVAGEHLNTENQAIKESSKESAYESTQEEQLLNGAGSQATTQTITETETQSQASETAKPKAGLWSQWRRDLLSVFERDPAARNLFEVLTTYPGVHAVLVHRLSHRLWVRGWRYPARLLSFFARMFTNVDIHPGAQIGERFFIDHGACVVVGETAVIGDDVTLYHGVTLGGTSWNKGKRHPTLGNSVMVGAGAKILGNITLGDRTRVGANSVVVEDVPMGCTVVGIPGKIVKLREAGRINAHGIDLDHHLIPDPVGKAISCLLGRLDALEARLENSSAQCRYQDCEVDNEICETDCPGGALAGGTQGQ